MGDKKASKGPFLPGSKEASKINVYFLENLEYNKKKRRKGKKKMGIREEIKIMVTEAVDMELNRMVKMEVIESMEEVHRRLEELETRDTYEL